MVRIGRPYIDPDDIATRVYSNEWHTVIVARHEQGTGVERDLNVVTVGVV
jgi:hypothetical protein